MCSIRLSTIVLLIYINLSFVTSARRCLNDTSKTMDNDSAEIRLRTYVPVYKNVEKFMNVGLSLNTLKKANDLTLQRNDELRTVDIDIGQNVSDSSVSEDSNVTYLWTDVSTPKQGNLASLCEKGLWIPLSININSSLQLEACLKFVVLNIAVTKQNVGYVVNSSLLIGIDHMAVSIYEKYIKTDIYFIVNGSYTYCTLELQIDKSDMDTFYWSTLKLWGNFEYSYFNEKNDGLRKYETDLHSLYSCEVEDTIFLEKNVAVLIKNLKYRAFRKADSIFKDKDIQHCPSSFWIFACIGIFICLLIIVTLVTIVCTCCKQKGRSGYKQFERHFEP